MNRTKFIK